MELSVGSGGKAMRDFLESVVLRRLAREDLGSLGDSALLEISGRVGFTTDSFVIQPLFFPGGDMGKLAVAGTVNDLVVAGVRPLFLSLALIVEEGFPMEDLERILTSARETADQAGARIVTGDTKVVRKGEADGLYVNTAGIGEVIRGEGTEGVREGDAIVVTGSPGDHGVAIMVARGDYGFEGDVLSDCAPLTGLLPLWRRDGIKWMRDITRGGLATVLCEFASETGSTVVIEESRVPFSVPVRSVAEILGIEPLYLPSEGKAVIVTSAESTEEILEWLRGPGGCPDARAVGAVQPRRPGIEAVLKTVSGGHRILERLTGELLPRIC